jgi:hypothetical protein
MDCRTHYRVVLRGVGLDILGGAFVIRMTTGLYWFLVVFVVVSWFVVMIWGRREHKIFMNVALVLAMVVTYMILNVSYGWQLPSDR